LDVRRVLRQVFLGLPNTWVARQARLQLFVDTSVSRYAEGLDLLVTAAAAREGCPKAEVQAILIDWQQIPDTLHFCPGCT
jgi:hypothetical protein